MSKLRVFTFAPDFGLPTVGPFALKLLAWLELAGIPYEQVIEGNPRKGPKGKNPWVELDGERIGDSEVIIDLLRRRHRVTLDEGLTREQAALGLAWRRTFEEHFHQVLEWELFFHPAGAAWMRASLASQMPRFVGSVAFPIMRAQFGRQLYARGIARHEPEVIAAKGRADAEALSAFLGDRPFLLTDHPTSDDAAVFGLLAPMIYWSMATPVATYARSIPNLLRIATECAGTASVRLGVASEVTVSTVALQSRRNAFPGHLVHQDHVLACVSVDGRDVGRVLINEGLALPWQEGAAAKEARIRHWCG